MSALRALRVTGFPRLLGAYTINQLGDSVAVVALALLVYDKTGDPLATTALFIAAQFLPAFFAPALTARTDQAQRHTMLAALYATEALMFVALAALVDNFWLPAVLLLAAVDGTVALTARGLTRSAQSAVLAPAGLLREGNGLINVGFGLASIIGLIVGGVLSSELGIATALLLDAASFIAVAALLAVRGPLPASEAPAESRERLLPRLREGFRYVVDRRRIAFLLLAEGLAIVLFTIVVPIEVVYAEETLKTDELGYSLLLGSWAVGILLGSGVFLVAKRVSLALLATLATAVIAIGYGGMALTDQLTLACVMSVVGGTGNGVQWVAVVTALQEQVDDEFQARVTGLLESVASAAPGIGFLAGGVLAAALSPPAAYGTASIGLWVLLAVGIVAFLIIRRGSGPRTDPVTASGSSAP